MATELVRPATAFAVPKQRRPRVKAEPHLAWLRRQACAVCGSRNSIEAAHLRAANPRYGKRASGMAEKPDDKWSTPLCADCHRDQHSANELEWWASLGVDPFSLALALFAASGDDELAEQILREHRP